MCYGGGYLIIELNKPAGPPTHRVRRRKRKIEKKEMHLMKKRLISFLLAVSMILSILPVGAFAAYDASSSITDITFSADGVPKETSGTGWTYKNNTLKIQSGFSFANNANYPLIKCDVDNYGTIMGGVYDGKVTNYGTISFGIFAQKPENKDGGTGTYYKISSSTGEELTFNSKLTANQAYTLATQAVKLTAPAGKVFSNGNNTYSIDSFSKDIVVTLSDPTLIPLKIDSTGWPVGTTKTEKGDTSASGDLWSYDAATKTLTIQQGESLISGYDLSYEQCYENGVPVPIACKVVNRGYLANGTYQDAVVNYGTIAGSPVFNGDVTNYSDIEGAAFNKKVENLRDPAKENPYNEEMSTIKNAKYFAGTVVNDYLCTISSYDDDSVTVFKPTSTTQNSGKISGAVFKDGSQLKEISGEMFGSVEYARIDISNASNISNNSFSKCVFTALNTLPGSFSGVNVFTQQPSGPDALRTLKTITMCKSSSEPEHINFDITFEGLAGKDAEGSSLVAENVSTAWVLSDSHSYAMVYVRPHGVDATSSNIQNVNDTMASAFTSNTYYLIGGFLRIQSNFAVDQVVNENPIPLSFETKGSYSPKLYPVRTNYGEKTFNHGAGWTYETRYGSGTLTITDPAITLNDQSSNYFPMSIVTSGSIENGAFVGAVTTSGSISGGELRGNVTLKGGASVTGGLFVSNVTLDSSADFSKITGGLFYKQLTASDGSKLSSVSIENNSRFSVEPYTTSPFSTVYTPAGKMITLHLQNAVKLEPLTGCNFSQSADNSTVTLTVPQGDTVLKYARQALNANLFDVSAKDITVGGTPDVTANAAHGVTGLGTITVKGCYKVTDGQADTSSTLDLADAKNTAGTYQVVLTVAEGTGYEANNAFTDPSWTFTVSAPAPTPAHTPAANDFVYNAPLHFETDQLDGLDESLKESLTKNNVIRKDDVTILYVDKDGQTLSGAPTEEGNYSFKITVKAAADGSYSATDEPLTDPSWTFTIHPASYSVYVTGGYAYTQDADGTEHPISSEVGVYPGTKIHLKVADPDIAFNGWQLGEGSAKPDAATSNLTLKDGSYFIMPGGDVKLSLAPAGSDSGNTGDNTGDSTGGGTSTAVSDDTSAGVGAALVVGGAALGGAAYLVGTQLWLETNLPADASIPTSRQQLADLLWKQAGMPEPASTALYPDVTAADSQKAARWCVEQGLLKDLGETFQPAKHVFRPQVIRAWKQLQTMQNNG